jgi:hypothetical protein
LHPRANLVAMLQAGYRGLTNFVTEIRDCKTYEAEKERVSKELEKVESVLSDTKSKQYDRIKSVLKLLYIQTLGYNISSFEKYCINMASSRNYLEKRAGYLTFPVFLNSETSFQDRIVGILQADIVSSDSNIKWLALSTLSDLAPTETVSKAIIDSVVPLLTQKSSRELCQRAFCCLSLLCWTELGWKFLTSQEASNLLQKFLGEKDPGLLTSLMSFLRQLISVAKDAGQLHLFTYVLTGLFQVLTWLLSPSFEASSYTYYEIPCPFLLSDVWKLIGQFPASFVMEIDKHFRSPISNSFLKCLSYIQKGDISNRRNATFSISLEALKVVSKLPQSQDLFTHTLTVVMSLISEDVRPTTRYFVLRALKELSFLPETWTSIQRNFHILLPFAPSETECTIQDEPLWFDQSIELLSAVCNAHNVEQVIDHMLRITSLFSLSSSQQSLIMEKCLNITQSFLRDEEKLVAVVVVLSSVCQDVEELVKLLLTKLEISQSLRRKCFAKVRQGSFPIPIYRYVYIGVVLRVANSRRITGSWSFACPLVGISNLSIAFL